MFVIFFVLNKKKKKRKKEEESRCFNEKFMFFSQGSMVVFAFNCKDENKISCFLAGTQGLLVLNDGDSNLKLNVTSLPTKSSNNDTEIPGHQVKKVLILCFPFNLIYP